MTLWGTYGLAATLYMITLGYFLVSTMPMVAQLIIFFSMIMYLFVYGMTFAPIMWMWVAEAIQPHLIGFAVMTNWAGSARHDNFPSNTKCSLQSRLHLRFLRYMRSSFSLRNEQIDDRNQR